MGLDDLKEVIEELQGVIETRNNYLSGKERRTRQVLIDPLLGALGWDVLDPGAVYLEHNKMDYALMSNGTPVAVIEAKPLGESLEKKAITQAITYAVENTIPYIIVTNGDRWEMYEVFKKADLEDKKLMEFQLSEHLPQECVLQASRIWRSFLAPPDDPEDDPVESDDSEDDPINPEGRTRLVVTMPYGKKIDFPNASDTFVEVIRKLGKGKVKNLNKMYNNIPLISTSDHPTYTTRKLDKYFIITHFSTERKKRILEEIASDLDVNMKVEIVPKD